MKSCGIYSWTNTVNGKKYIGESKNIDQRWIKHIQNARLGVGGKFYNALRKYGESVFVKEILETYDNDIDRVILLQREKYYILKYDTLKNGYNTADSYDTITNNPNKFKIYKKICKTKKELNKTWVNKGGYSKCVNGDILIDYLNDGWTKGRIKFSDDHKNKISKVLKNKWKNGYTHSPEALKIMSNTFKGKKHTEKTKKMMSENSVGKYTLNWFINKYGQDEGKEKYLEKCKKLKDRKMKSGADWFISRYGETNGLKYFLYKEKYMKNRYYIWINNGIDMIIIKRSLKPKYINDGWTVGMLKSNKSK